MTTITVCHDLKFVGDLKFNHIVDLPRYLTSLFKDDSPLNLLLQTIEPDQRILLTITMSTSK